MIRNIFIPSLVVLLVALVISCQSSSTAPTSETTPTPSASTQSAHKHWVQDERLRSMMAQISKLNSSLPTGLPDDVESSERLEARQSAATAALLADELARTAQELPGVLEGKPVSEADELAFFAEAQTLHDQAIRLRDAAQNYQVEKMQRTLNQINMTCISCHSRFREFSGSLDFGRVEEPQGDRDSSVSGNKSAP